jgi:hypothetical protein
MPETGTCANWPTEASEKALSPGRAESPNLEASVSSPRRLPETAQLRVADQKLLSQANIAICPIVRPRLIKSGTKVHALGVARQGF